MNPVDDTLAALAALSLEQRAALERLLGRERVVAGEPGGPEDDLAPIAPRADPSAFPLSFAQRRLWFLDQLFPGAAAYNIHGAVRLRGTLDIAALAQSLGAITARHEALRCRFTAVDGRPEQSVTPPGGPALPVVDLSGLGSLSAGRCAMEARCLAVDEARRPFDLARGPLLRTTLLRVDAADFILLVTMHHIVSDGWSVGIFLREMAVLYAAFAVRHPSDIAPLPPLPLQYADFAAWQRRRLAGDRLAREVDHWRSRLAGVPELRLPSERTVDSGSVPVIIPAPLVERLKQLGRGAGASLFMTLLAAFEVLLLRWSGQRDFATGTPIANRNRPEIEGLIGFFVNTLVLRADLAGDPTFRGLLDRAREVCLDAYAHQDLPFEKLVEELQPERRLGHNPLFSVLIVLQNAPRAASGLPGFPELPGLVLESLPVRNGMARFDLTLDLAEEEQGIAGVLEHGAAGLSRLAARRMAGHFLALLEAVVAAPGSPLSALPVLTAAERHQMLTEWAGPEQAVPEHGFSELFAARCRQSPAAIAVVCAGETLTYGELERRANQLAWHLRRRGVGPEGVVAISLERSLEMVVGLFGVLAAGAAYLPIDPHNPRERRSFMLEDCGATVLLTQERWAASFRRPGLRVLCLDSDWETVAGEPEGMPPRLGAPGNALALLYTSGSTGQPKATVVEERGFLNLCLWFHDACALTASTRAFLGIAFSFDAAFKNIVAPLLAGGRLVLANPGPFDPAEVWAALRDEKVTLLVNTPSQVYPVLHLAAADGFASLASLEGLVLGGELAVVAELRPWLSVAGRRAALTNMYGPSEGSDTLTSFRAASEDLAAERLPIGRPTANVRLLVADNDLQPLPVGVPGELCASGICLARGYFARPELTAQKFIPHPLGFGERLYRTGDLARWLPDGNLELLGRLDDQVKIRGIRIEPAEVEAALREHPAVRNAVVLARPGRRASDFAGVNVRLVAWIVRAEGATGPSEGELRQFLRGRLPDVMAPSAFVPLAALPLNPRGKLDRTALPEPEPGGVNAEALSSPGDPAEELMAALFAEILGRERVGVHDSFFELGGHSLLATRLVSRVRTVFGVELPVRRLFESPTPAKVAAAVRDLGSTPPPPPLRRWVGGGPVPLSLAQQRLWVLHQLSPALVAYHIPAALRLRGPLGTAALARALSMVVARHAALRTLFPHHFPRPGEGPVQAVEPPAPVPLPEVDLGGLPEAAREAAVLGLAGEESRRPFDLERGPLLRLCLLRLGGAEHVLLLTVHHLVSDGWSAAIFLRELSAFYTAFLTGVAAGLPTLPVQYSDYAIWQRDWLRGEVLEAQLAYWKARLAGAPPFLDLPTDRPRPRVESQAGASVPLRLSAPLVERLRHLGRETGATLYMTLFTGFQALLARCAGEEAVSVGTHVAGRNRAELEGLIGFFVNTLVIHTRQEGAPSVRGLIGRVREAVLGAFSHQDLPFEKLVEALNPERDPRWSPLFQVVFTLQNVPRGELRLPGIEASRLDVDTEVVQFDLIASLAEEADSGAGAVGAIGSLRYRTALFNGSTIRRLAANLEVLLTGMADDPDRRAADLPLLSAAERAQVLEEWSGAGFGVEEGGERGETTLPSLFAEQAARTSDRPAVVLDGVALSYGELLQRADRVAGALRRLGVGPEARVAICLERSPDLLPAILGVMRSGGAYVPLDPAAPRARLAFLLEDSAPAVVLAASALLAALPATAVPVLTVEEALRASPDPAPGWSSGDLAYIIYTSGSTGRPKGTLVSHGALTAFARGLRAAVSELRGDAQRSLSLNAAFSFDASLQQIVQLAAGHALWIVPEEARRDSERLAGLLRAAGLDGFDCTPSQLEILLAAMETSGRPPRFVLVGGEAIPPALWERLAAHPHTRFYNMYGPTECTVDATARLIDAVDPIDPIDPIGGGPDLGRPLAGYRLHLLDAGGLPLPAGFRGEIWIGGPALARGYWCRPDLTADRFRPDPFAGAPGARLYRTGDLGRWLPDGRIESFGRADRQIKLRGFRIEPGEIEIQLAAHPGVATAAVGVRIQDGVRDGATLGDRRLVAWIVPAGAVPPAGDELRQFLRSRLPEAMVPTVFVALAALPLSPGGKLDRTALPEPEPERAAAEAGSPPGDPAAELMAELFAEILGCARVGVHVSFFELGGHSLLATRLVSRVRSVFGVELPVRCVFESPTPAELAAAVRNLDSALPAPPPLRRRVGGGPAPLSLAQQRLWVLHQLSPGLIAYHIPAALRLRGPLDTAALERSLAVIVARHEALRTHFPQVSPSGPISGEGPVQAVEPPAPVPLPEADLAGLPEAVREAAALGLAREESRRPFDLERGPLLRLCLLRLGGAEHVLLLTVHHLVSDGWSAAIFLRELSALYTASLTGVPAGLPALPVQYSDYAAWQRGWLHGEVLEAQLAYWKERLAGAPRFLDLPTDRPRPPVETQTGASVPLRLSAPLVERLRHLGREAGATLYMTLLTGFQALLARCAGEEAVSMGTHVAGRNCAELEGLIGFFVNTLVIHTRHEGEPSVRGLIGRVREAVLGAFSHQDLPFEKLVEALNPERDPRWSPLFQVVFTLQNAPRGELRLPGIEMSRLDVDTDIVQFDLIASLSEGPDSGGGVLGSLRYRTALFNGSTIRRLAANFEVLLAGMADDPDRRAADLPLLSEAERAQVMAEWSGAGTGAEEGEGMEATLPTLFAEQAARTPDRPAVVLEGVALSYGELLRRADRVAGVLRRLGVGPEVRVAICLERSPDLLTAILGVMRSGGAYVPLDPASPRERLADLLEDSAPAVVLTASSLSGRLPAAAAPVLTMEEALSTASRPDDGSPFPEPSFQHLAYVIYTSGSTGRPKGTPVRHGALTAFARGLRAAVAELRGDVDDIPLRLSLNAAFFFDASLQQIVQLAAGHSLWVVPEEARRDGERLAELLFSAGLDGFDCTPSQLEVLLAAMETSRRPPRFVLVGGEAIPPALWQRLAAHSHTRFYNVYGPTECTVDATARLIDPIDPIGGRPDLGRPLAGYRLHLLDAGGLPLPAGFRGEIWLGGPALARGYWRRPDLTADRFRPDPFGDAPGERLYRTGDLGCWLPDGRIESFGRTDRQIKLLGFRIEPGEIEAALERHPRVRAAVVVTRQGASGDKSLVGYVVAAAEPFPTAGELRGFLQERLPPYMIPAIFVFLDRLPLTSNGKVDRQALPAPERSTVGSSRPALPADPLEAKLVELWAAALGLDQVRIDDSFFDLGGHSLSALGLAARLRETFGVRLPVRRLFTAPTPAAMAELLREMMHRTDGPAGDSGGLVVALQPQGGRAAFFCVHPGGGDVTVYRDFALRLDSGRPFLALRAPGLEEGEEPLYDIGSLAERHLRDVRRAQPEGPWHLGGWSSGAVVVFEMARRLRAAGGEVATLVLLDPPDFPFPAADPDGVEILAAFAGDLGLSPAAFGLSAGEARALSPEERLTALLAVAHAAGLPLAGRADLERRLRVFRASIEAIRTYEPGSWDGPLTLLEAAARPAPATFWRALATAVHAVPGGHSTILQPPFVDELARRVREALAM